MSSMSMVTLTSQPLSNDTNKTRNESFVSDFLDSRKKFQDGEIGIFGAEKYFNGGINEKKIQKFPRNIPQKPPQIETSVKTQERKTPSVPSESSCGSQNALLQSLPHQKKPKKRPGRSFLATIGCNCYCNDEKSVDTNEHVDEVIANSVSKRRVSQGEKVVEEPARIMEEKHLSKNVDGVHDDDDGNKMRKSLEVFGSPMLQKKNNSLSLEKKLTLLKWETNDVEVVEICDGMYEDDEGSDASSDLFEITSFTNNNPNSILLRQASDHITSGCVTPTTCYAPSEASVEWSVVTASAAEFSVFSDSEEPISLPTLSKAQKNVLNARKETERRRLGLLSGCKSQKAVRVAGDVYRTSADAVQDPRRFHVARSRGPVTKV